MHNVHKPVGKCTKKALLNGRAFVFAYCGQIFKYHRTESNPISKMMEL
jgi:hypothetical protein